MFQQKKFDISGLAPGDSFSRLSPFRSPHFLPQNGGILPSITPHDQLRINKLFCDLVILVFSVEVIPRVDEINAYLDRTIDEPKAEISEFPAEHRADWAPLSELFLKTISSHF